MGVGLAREEITADDIRKVKFLFMIIWRDIRERDYALFGPPTLACSLYALKSNTHFFIIFL